MLECYKAPVSNIIICNNADLPCATLLVPAIEELRKGLETTN